uniref:CUB domain-containing protein n=1 Tax=Gongylonema pulchrum TaxID=637853 RepID=A0A183E9J0_9BILA
LEPASSYFDEDLRYLRFCGGHSSKKTFDGEIQSPGFPALYPKNVTCNWLIRVDPGKKIYIRVRYLELSPTMAECERASLYVIDGYRYESPDLMRKDEGSQVKFCGSQLYYTEEGMKSYMSTGNRLIVKFVTKDSPSPSLLAKYEDEGKPIGFRLVWTEVDDQLSDGQGFACKGGELCIDNGQNICASRSQLCIDKSLTCNGIHNCAENDHSDEQDLILWQRARIRRRVEKRKREQLEAATITDSNGKNAVVWEPTNCRITDLDSPSIQQHCPHRNLCQHHHHHHHQQQQQQNHFILPEMNTFRSALL